MSIFSKDRARVAVVQSEISQGKNDDNWRGACALIREAMADEPQLVVLPEALITGVNFIILRQMSEPVPDGRCFELLSGAAREHEVHVVAGILERDGDDVFDSAVLIDPRGELLAKYRRRFVWVGERNYVTAGDEAVVVDSEIGRIGLIVGYDLCFPAACDTFLEQDVDLIACPASVFEQLNHSAIRLAQARAVDCHCYFAYANAVGFHQFANMRYGGGSGVFADPYYLQVQHAAAPAPQLGTLARCAASTGWAAADTHVPELAAARAAGRLPFKGDARFGREPDPELVAS